MGFCLFVCVFWCFLFVVAVCLSVLGLFFSSLLHVYCSAQVRMSNMEKRYRN